MWIELHDTSRDHPKITDLAELLGVKTVVALGHMCSLWTWTLRFAPDGCLESFNVTAIERGAQWDGERGAFVSAAKNVGLLDGDDGALHLHDWADYAQHLKAADRKRRERIRKSSQRNNSHLAEMSRDTHGTNENVPPMSRDTHGTLNSCPHMSRRPDQTRPDQTDQTRPDQTDECGARGGVTLSSFAEQIANAGIALQLSKSDQVRFSRLTPVEPEELRYAIDRARVGVGNRPAYVLSVIEGERKRAAEIASGPAPPGYSERPRRKSRQEEAIDAARAEVERYNARIRAEQEGGSQLVQGEDREDVRSLSECDDTR